MAFPVDGRREGGGFVRFVRRRHQNQQKQTKINVKVEFKAFLSESIQAGAEMLGDVLSGRVSEWFALLYCVSLGRCQEPRGSRLSYICIIIQIEQFRELKNGFAY